MEFIEEVPGAGRKAATWIKINKVQPTRDPLENQVWDIMECVFHANGDSTFQCQVEFGGLSYQQAWAACLKALDNMGCGISSAEPDWAKDYGVIQAYLVADLKVEVYRDNNIVARSRYIKRNHWGWGLVDYSETNAELVLAFFKRLLTLWGRSGADKPR